MNGNNSCPAHTCLPRVLGSLPCPDHSPLCFYWEPEDLVWVWGFQLVWLPLIARHLGECRKLWSHVLSYLTTRGKRGQVARPGAAHRELLREGLMSLLSSTPYTVKPLNANCEVTLETTASFCALAGADADGGMSQKPQRLNRRQRFSWS